MKIKNLILIAIGAILVSLLSSGFVPYQEKADEIWMALENYVLTEAPEKVYVHTDKPYYTAGEVIWFQSYLVNASTHLASTKSKVVYIELIGPDRKVLVRKKIYVDDLAAGGQLEIDPKWETGVYILRAYTNYMRNQDDSYLFRKQLRIWKQTNTSKLVASKRSTDTTMAGTQLSETSGQLPSLRAEFFPEGGTFVAGQINRIAVQLKNREGSGVETQGRIVDSKGVQATIFKTYTFGLGQFSLNPVPGETYFLEVSQKDRVSKIELPPVAPAGYSMMVKQQSENLQIDLHSTYSFGLKGAFLVGHTRGLPFIKKNIDQTAKQKTLQVATKALKDGVAHFTLFDSKGNPVCERMIFIYHPGKNLEAKISTNKKVYSPRERVNVAVAIKEVTEDKKISSVVSMSVIDSKTMPEAKDQQTIESWLLLNSDLEQNIGQPGFFFRSPDQNHSTYMMDLVMLTNGWKRFRWNQLMYDITVEKKYAAEEGLYVKGRTTVWEEAFQNKKSLVQLNIMEPDLYQKKEFTNESGHFSFGPLVFTDSIPVVMTARDPWAKSERNQKNLSVMIEDGDTSPEVTFDPGIISTVTVLPDYAEEYLNSTYLKKVEDFKYGRDVTQLETVLLEAEKKDEEQTLDEKLNELSFYGQPDNRLIMDSLGGTEGQSAFSLLQRVAGVQVSGVYPDQRILIRGISSFNASTDPLFLLDGIPVDGQVVSAMQASEIAFIDVLKSAATTSIYGSRGGNGVIAFYTHRGGTFSTNQERVPGVTNFTLQGFEISDPFPAPNYAIKQPEHAFPDLRTTLFWKSDIQYAGNKDVLVDFYTGDATGDYQIHLEGISRDGRTIMGTYDFVVE